MTCVAEDYVASEQTAHTGSEGHLLTPVRRRGPWAVTLGVTAGYLLFTVAVHLRLLDDLDVAVGDAARPGGAWGPVQIRAARVVGVLDPAHLAVALLLVVAALGLLRRSLRPCVVTAAVGAPVVVLTLGTKWAMAHWDASTEPVAHVSFPSGHMVSAVTAVGIVVLLLRRGSRWAWALPAAMGCAVGSALVLASVHPATDVIGAALLATAALTGAEAAELGRWAHPSRGTRQRSWRDREEW